MLENGSVLSADGREYTILEMLGRGANTIAYLAECRHGELFSKCILKEYSPQNDNNLPDGKARFIASGKEQNRIRQFSALSNQTPPVSHIFEANGTAYIDVACYNGTTLDKLHDLSLLQYIELCRTIAKTVGCYHASGYLYLDLKPENIFILQSAPDDTVTQLVELIDFDSIRDLPVGIDSTVFSYTRDWAAPEQLNPYSAGKLSKATDIYTVGEMVFYLLFGRHSTEAEHRGFSKYPFDACKEEYRKYTARPDIRSLFTKLFRGTIRSSPTNRFADISDAVKLLEQLTDELSRKDHIIPTLPSVSPDFVGRDTELKAISENLKNNPVMFLTGVGGIGKSTLVKNYITNCASDHDVIVYLEYDGDILHTFCDDMQLQISTASRLNDESLEEYFARKLSHFKSICSNKHVLFVLDNFSGKITKDLSRIIDCGYDTIIVTRNRPPKNSFAFMELGAIDNTAELIRLITINLERQVTKEERSCFEEIITLVQGHTLVIELIARQIASGRIDTRSALELIRKHGFSRFSAVKIGNYKDGEEVYDTLSAIISALFDAGNMSADEQLTLKVLSLFDVRGLDADLVFGLIPDISTDTTAELARQGWIYADEKLRVHPVIAETIHSWLWPIDDDVAVMEHHKKAIDIYYSISNSAQICEILREAEIYKNSHPRHIITAMYHNMVGDYFDLLVDGKYVTYTDEEAKNLEDLLDAMDAAIEEMELSSDCRKTKYLMQYYLSLSCILIRTSPYYHQKAAELLGKVSELISENEPPDSMIRSYYYMAEAWYYSLAEPDAMKAKSFIDKAAGIAKQALSTDVEYIDVILIPSANCYFYLYEYELAITILDSAIDLCREHSEALLYIDKQAELLNCVLDVYMEMQNMEKCRELIAEIDRINEKYKDQGIFREVDPEIREKAGL